MPEQPLTIYNNQTNVNVNCSIFWGETNTGGCDEVFICEIKMYRKHSCISEFKFLAPSRWLLRVCIELTRPYLMMRRKEENGNRRFDQRPLIGKRASCLQTLIFFFINYYWDSFWQILPQRKKWDVVKPRPARWTGRAKSYRFLPDSDPKTKQNLFT